MLLETLELGSADLLAQPWLPDPSSVESALNSNFFRNYQPPTSFVVNRPDGLQVALLPAVALRLEQDRGEATVPVLVADQDEPVALDLGGDDRSTEVVGVAGSLPLLGAVGVLADIRTSAAGSGPTVPSAEVQVVADADTPDAVLDEVAEAAGATWRTRSSVRDALGERYGGAQSVAYALTALACALVALLALGAGVTRHLRDYRRDVASLRVLGVSTGTARRAGRAELASLTVLVLAVVVAGGWLAVTLLLDGLPLLAVPVAGLPLDTAPHAWPLVVPAVLAAAAVVLVGGRARAVRASTTRPSLLREEEQMIQLFGAIVRGLRSRALLSAGSVLLTALAIGSAVLGPVFSEAVTNSYVVTRLQESPPGLTGLSRVYTPDSGVAIEQAERDAVAASDALTTGPWQEPVVTAQSERFSALRGVVTFWSRADACDVLEVEGRCPERQGEVLMLAADVEKTGAEVGQPAPARHLRDRPASPPSASRARVSARSSWSAPTTPRARVRTG